MSVHALPRRSLLTTALLCTLFTRASAEETTPNRAAPDERQIDPADSGFAQINVALGFEDPEPRRDFHDANPILGGRSISDEALLKLIGRADLLPRMRARARFRKGMAAAGGAATGLGLVLALGTLASDIDVGYSGCPIASGGPHCGAVSAGYTVAGTLAAAGLATLITGLAAPVDTISTAELQPAIDAYNRAHPVAAPATIQLQPVSPWMPDPTPLSPAPTPLPPAATTINPYAPRPASPPSTTPGSTPKATPSTFPGVDDPGMLDPR